MSNAAIGRLMDLIAKGRDVEDEVDDEIENLNEAGADVAEVVSTLSGTDWRYVLENSGRQVAVAHRDSLFDWYQEMLDQAFAHFDRLHDIGERSLSAMSLFEQLDARETAGFFCHKVALEAGRVARYLRPDEQTPDAIQDIRERLSPIGLKWDGAYEIESWPGENDALYDRASQLESRRAKTRLMSTKDDVAGREAR
jgi:hypothetical protein